MTRDEKLILAMAEAMTLWDRLAETGEHDKARTIDALFSEGKLHKPYTGYQNGCPLCEEFRPGMDCSECPWPAAAGDDIGNEKCCNWGSPFIEWSECCNSEARKAAAKKVLALLESIEF